MKKIFNILAASVLVLMATSCDRKVEFEHETFATFNTVTYNVDENAETLTVPVSIYNPTGKDTQIAVSVVPGTASEGTDFEIVSPANGILTFSGETTTLNIEIAISSDFVGEFTGGKDFRLQLTSATDGVSVGNYGTALINILDIDHPLAGLFGEWSGTLTFADSAGSQLPTVLKISGAENDDTYTKLVISGLEAAYAQYALPLEAIYDSATKTVIIPAGQVGMYVSSSYEFLFIGLDDNWSNIINATFQYDDVKKTLTQTSVYGIIDNLSGQLYSAYYPGAVFTKK